MATRTLHNNRGVPSSASSDVAAQQNVKICCCHKTSQNHDVIVVFNDANLQVLVSEDKSDQFRNNSSFDLFIFAVSFKCFTMK